MKTYYPRRHGGIILTSQGVAVYELVIAVLLISILVLGVIASSQWYNSAVKDCVRSCNEL